MRRPGPGSLRHPAWGILVLLLAGLSPARAATMELLFPPGGKIGATPLVAVTGKFDAWPAPKVWTDTPGLVFKPEAEKGQYSVTIGKEVPPGPHLVRIHDLTGASDLKTFVVGRYEEAAEKEPNDAWQKSQSLEKLPVTLNGRLDKSGDVDSFTFHADAGRWLVAMVDAYSIGAPIDAYLHLLDEQGTRIALGNDSFNIDPLLAFKVEKSGRYTLQISGFVHPPQAEVRFAGSSSTLYRLSITDGPVIREAFTTEAGKLQVSGWNLEAVGTAGKDGWVTAEHNVLTDPSVENRLRFPPGKEPARQEQEPNNKLDEAQAITIPCSIHGCIQKPGDEDRFAFTAKKGDKLDFRIYALANGFPLDASLKVEDSAGKQLMRDDIGVNMDDPHIAWVAPADGKFHLAVGDLYRHGGDDFRYRLEVLPQTPGFKGKADKNAYQVISGRTNVIRITVSRLNGFTGKLSVIATNLPPGVEAPAMPAPEKDGEVRLTLTARADSKPSSQPIRVLLASPDLPSSQAAATFEFRAKDSKTGDFLINETDALWLNVIAPNATPEAPAEKKKK